MKLEDVAKRAKVSIATVSRVVNNVGPIKSATRTRVLKAIQELKYYPNMHARHLAGVKSNTVGMIVSNLANPFFLDIFRSLENEANRRGFDVLVANTDYNPRRLAAALQLMRGRRLAGLAVIVSEMEPTQLQELMEGSLPVVVFDVPAAGRHIRNIRVRYDRCLERVVEYLHSMGHRRMAFVGHHAELDSLQERKRAFLNTMKRYAGEVAHTVVTDRDSPAGGQQAARTLLASGFKPTAIICVNDFMALGVLKELREHGLTVPRDVSVTGYDNISLSEFAMPPLTTVNIPREEIGRNAFSALVPEETTNGDGTEPVRQFLIEPDLVIRESTGPARKV
jgi:DNA-binding LacI/PurR family transcriptional regulator